MIKKILKIILAGLIVELPFSASAASLTTNPFAQFINHPSGNSITDMMGGFYNFALMAAGGLAMGAIIYGAILYTLSSGNSGKQSEAKEWITQALLGLILLLGAYLILSIINPRITTLHITGVTQEADLMTLNKQQAVNQYKQCNNTLNQALQLCNNNVYQNNQVKIHGARGMWEGAIAGCGAGAVAGGIAGSVVPVVGNLSAGAVGCLGGGLIGAMVGIIGGGVRQLLVNCQKDAFTANNDCIQEINWPPSGGSGAPATNPAATPSNPTKTSPLNNLVQ